jgi:hypothetical protein BACCOPRO_00945
MDKTTILYTLICIGLLFAGIFYNLIGVITNFQYTDELFILLVIAVAIVQYKKSLSQKEKIKELRAFLLITLFFLFYSFLFGKNNYQSALTDYAIILKPFLAFYVGHLLSCNLTRMQKKNISKLALAGYCVLALVIFSGESSQAYFSGSPFLSMNLSCVAITYYYFSPSSNKNKLIAILILATGIVLGKSKLFGFLCFFIFMTYYNKPIRSNPKVIIMCIICMIATIFVAWEKITFYFIDPIINAGRIQDLNAARAVLFIKSFYVLKDHFLLGPGFGTYASFASAKYYSPLYIDYNMYWVQGLEKGSTSFMCDTFFPELVQFGIVGIILYVLFWKKRITEIYRNLYKTRNLKQYKTSMMIVVFFIIEGIAASTFTQAQGMYVMFIFGVVSHSHTRAFQISKQQPANKKIKQYNGRKTKKASFS